jgi:predicted HicB family RNase H-like nuclease
VTRTKKPRRGRPPLADPSRVLSVVRTIKITEADDAAWRAGAEADGVSVNEWIRERVNR